MEKPKYPAGFHFITSTTKSALNNEDRRAIRSHTTRAYGKRRKAVRLRSWISPDRSLDIATASLARKETSLPVTSLKCVGGDFSALQLPMGIEPTMIQDLIQLINLDKEGVYPYEVCLQVHPVERGWFPYMISDICCVHSMMFSVRAFVDGTSHDGQISRQASFHYAQTLQLLQSRLNAFEHGQREMAFRDSTIMVIIILAAAAELTGDFAAVQNHVDGLLKIVSLRGGVGSLNTHNNMQIKVCRTDLGLALRVGSPARLFRERIVWDCYIANRGIIRCNHDPYQAQIHTMTDALDWKLGNCWKDLHAFSCMSNLAYQTTRKLSPDTYNEMMISILYRLLNLSCKQNVLQEAIRTSLLTFASTIFLTRLYMKQPYEHLFHLFGSALFKLYQSASIKVPPPIVLWLMIMYQLVAYTQPAPEDWQSVWLGEAISLTGVSVWPGANGVLKSIMWVDFVHDTPGRKVFDAAVQRLERPGEVKVQPATL